MSAGFGFWNHNIDLIQDPFEGCEYYACDSLQTALVAESAIIDYWPCDGVWDWSHITENLASPGNTLLITSQGGGALTESNISSDIWQRFGGSDLNVSACTDDNGYHWDHISGNFGSVALTDTRTTSEWWNSTNFGSGMAIGMLVRNPLPSGVTIDNTQQVLTMRVISEDTAGSSLFRWAVGPDNATIQEITDGKPTFAHGLDFQEPRYILCTVDRNSGTGSHRWSMYDVATETRIATMSSGLIGAPLGNVDATADLVLEFFVGYQRVDFKELAIFKLDNFYAEIDPLMARLKDGMTRNQITYYPGDECFTSGCRPYKCDAFQQAIIDTGAAQLFPLDDADTETIIPVDGRLNSLGTPIVVDGAELYLVAEAQSRGKDWLDPANNAVGARAIGGDLTDQTCSTYGTYFRTGVWASAINNTPTSTEMNSFGGYIWNLHTGSYSGLFNVAYGIEWSFTGQTSRRIDFINFGVSIASKAANTVRVSYDNVFWEGVVDTAIVDMAADESFWWHLDVGLTMGTPSAGAVPLTSTWTLYINGQYVMLQANYTRNFVNLNTSQPVFFRSYNGDGSLPGYVIPSRITLPHDELHALNYYIGKDLDVDVISQGYDRNFTTYTVPPECL